MKWLALAAPLVFALAFSAGAAPQGSPGVTPTSIAIGSSGPRATVDGDVLQGAAAYFKYVDARGGVFGRKLDFTALDDAGDPATTLANARELVQQDGVFALFSVVGTDANLSIRSFTNSAGVPQVFSASGAAALGHYPWTIGYRPTSFEEGELYARDILAAHSKTAKIAVLYESNEDGKDLLRGLRHGLGVRAATLIAATAGYDPTAADVQAQIAELQASGANTFCIFAFGTFATEGFVDAHALDWRPLIYIDASASPSIKLAPQSTAAGAISILWSKDPNARVFANDPGVELGAMIIRKYVPGGDPSNAQLVAGMAEAFSFVDALRHAGKDPTRRSFMNAVTHLDEASNPFLIPGVTVHTMPDSRFPLTSAQLERWQAGRWAPFGGVQSAFP